MRKTTCFIFLLLAAAALYAQTGTLTVEKIMRDPKWIGNSPSGLNWSYDSKYLYFNWNPDKAYSDSLYYITREDLHPHKTTYSQRQSMHPAARVVFNTSRTSIVYEFEGDIFIADTKTGKERRITQTAERELNPQFAFNDTRVVYSRAQNLYSWNMADGLTVQLTNFQQSAASAPTAATTPAAFQRGTGGGGGRGTGGGGAARGGGAAGRGAQPETQNNGDQQDKWLKEDQLNNFDVLRLRKERRDTAEAMTKALPKNKELRVINIEDKNLSNLSISPDGRFISYRLVKTPAGKITQVPNYVTESGFTEEIPNRTKVGAPQGTQEFFVFDTEKDTVFSIRPDTVSLPGLTDLPAYLSDYPKIKEEKSRRPLPRSLNYQPVLWSPSGTHAVLDIRAQDYKDLWLVSLDARTGKLHTLDRQHDDAWIGGPGIGGGFGAGTRDGLMTIPSGSSRKPAAIRSSTP